MNLKSILLVLFLLPFCMACEAEQKTEVNFCLELDEKGHCAEPAKQFPFGSKIYVACTSSKPFEGKAMKGNIYFLKEGEKVFFNFKHFDLQPGQQSVNSYIPFDQFGGKGGFYIEFVDENGKVLEGNSLEIVE